MRTMACARSGCTVPRCTPRLITPLKKPQERTLLTMMSLVLHDAASGEPRRVRASGCIVTTAFHFCDVALTFLPSPPPPPHLPLSLLSPLSSSDRIRLSLPGKPTGFATHSPFLVALTGSLRKSTRFQFRNLSNRRPPRQAAHPQPAPECAFR